MVSQPKSTKFAMCAEIGDQTQSSQSSSQVGSFPRAATSVNTPATQLLRNDTQKSNSSELLNNKIEDPSDYEELDQILNLWTTKASVLSICNDLLGDEVSSSSSTESVRTLHAPEVKRHVDVPPHQILNNAAISRLDGYIENLQFQILMLYKHTILSIQHMLEGNTKETIVDLVGICAALLRFAKGKLISGYR
ncbi:MAG: hypothetical protein EZS28_026420 [Streblomastix strix]|uniref:Uncharacterized protein n=1 Tax=Streblomastix strix TaxID=222440 RepID=A0A5J4V6D5_9EUKA|nr:MAG: hypothetical protein EZS28_026420 [Streblomastix strix]